MEVSVPPAMQHGSLTGLIPGIRQEIPGLFLKQVLKDELAEPLLGAGCAPTGAA